MTTPVADRAFLDTNVLLAATDESRGDHQGAVSVLDEWPASGVVLYTSGQVLREYLVVATRPVDVNGLGITRADAVGNVRSLRARLTPLAEDGKVGQRLLDVLDAVDCRGKRIHDANIVATMLAHGIETIVTANIDDFAVFADHVRVAALDR